MKREEFCRKWRRSSRRRAHFWSRSLAEAIQEARIRALEEQAAAAQAERLRLEREHSKAMQVRLVI